MQLFETSLKKYIDTFLNQEMYFESDIRNLEFFKANPTNTDADNIRMKLSAVNDNELHINTLADDMISHILNLNIDSRLQNGDLGVVEAIAQLNARGKAFNLLTFASVYCNFHRPDAFPIYSEQHFHFYKTYISEKNLAIDPASLTAYPVFSRALNHVIKQLGLEGKMNYLQLRKFGWLYVDSVMRESGLDSANG